MSSTNVLMIGIAIVDISTLLLTVLKHASLVDIENNECVTSNSLIEVYFDLTLWGLQDYFRRCSTWLGLLMAMIRTMIVKNMLGTNNPGLTKQRCGWFGVLTIVLLASTLSIFWNLRFKVVENRLDFLPVSSFRASCSQSSPFSLFGLSDEPKKPGAKLLISELSFELFNLLQLEYFRNDHTTKLVIFMTVAFFIAEAPLGIIYMINAFYYANDGLM
uniref:G_PROTEIN_RECEP_F1_2 domain-containing protein n=1 Tax=Caenorhabditis tropicalis TaxID=1561998 RepID=A0A1I7TAQ8_9PELO